MEKIKITEIVKAVSGKFHGDNKTVVSGVSIDSRTVKRGDIFFAIKGGEFDGHNFIQDAIKKGAVAIVISRLFATGEPTWPSPVYCC
ncbi:MAG: Mur ligase domain-containing protein [Elusimicrobiota bacterium]